MFQVKERFALAQELEDSEMLQRFRLDGAVQTRIFQRSLTVSAQGTNLPLEKSVLEHVRSMGRIFEFRSRSVHNFDRLTLSIKNTPTGLL